MEAERLMQHMPKYYRVIAEIIVLQKTMQIELEEIDLMAKDVLNQFFIYTATWSLPIWERIFGLAVGDETSNIQERRENLISKLRSYGTTTKEMIVRVGNAFTNRDVQVIEHNERYIFEVVFAGTAGIPKNIKDFKKMIEVIKPAHLGYELVYPTVLEHRIETTTGIGKYNKYQLKVKTPSNKLTVFANKKIIINRKYVLGG